MKSKEIFKNTISGNVSEKFYEIFPKNKSFKKIIPFLGPDFFSEENKFIGGEIDESSSEEENNFNTEAFNLYKAKLRTTLIEKIHNLGSIQVPKINFSALFNNEIPNELGKICQNKINNWVKSRKNELLALLNKESMKKNENAAAFLKEKIDRVASSVRDFYEFRKYLATTDLFKFINILDPTLINNVINNNKYYFANAYESLEEVIESKIKELASKKAAKEVKEHFKNKVKEIKKTIKEEEGRTCCIVF